MTAPFHLNWKISLAVGAVLILGGVLLVVRSSPVSVRQPLKIGYSSFPPYQLVRNDGSPDGFAVQTLKEAARRLGQPLQWTRITGNPDQALDSGQVDLYPMLAILPDRLARFAISPPWWENALVLISPAEAPLSTADSTVGRKIALINASFGLQRMRNLFPQAIPVTSLDYRVVVSHVCQGTADGAIMESRLANSLQFLDECRHRQLTMKWFPELNLTYGVAGRKAQQPVADALFAEVLQMSQDGTLTALGQPWGITTSNQRNSLARAAEAESRSRYWIFALAVFGAILTFLLWVSLRLRRATRISQQALAARSQLMANVSHEIRTPLHGILGMVDLLAESGLDAGQSEKLKAIRGCGQLLSRQIDDLLDMAKLEAGKLQVERIAYHPSTVLRAAMQLERPLADRKGISLTMEGDDVTGVLGDPLRVQQVLMNLVSNAIKFTDHGGVAVCLHASPEVLRFAVRDTGLGIDAKTQAQLFAPFTQADSSTARRFGGTGLGLSISRELVRLMGGEMGVVSQSGGGSEFWFTLPRAAATEAPVALPAAATESLLPLQAHLLIAEDNRLNQLILQRFLEKLGYTSLVVDNGAAACEAMERHRFDAILMDCHMPELDGFEATRRIRAMPEPAGRLPIIAVTAAAFADDVRRAREAGMNDILAKPFSLDQLANALRGNLPASETHRETPQS